MKLRVLSQLPGEIAHFYEPSSNSYVFSKVNSFWGLVDGRSFSFALPLGLKKRFLASSRLGRRLSRVDKSVATLNYHRDGVVAIFQGRIFFYDLLADCVTVVGSMHSCRTILHNGIAVTPYGIFFGEYGANPDRNSVPLWGSVDDGRTWDIAYQFPEKSIRHIHGVYVDPYSSSLWIATGDFDGECGLFEADRHDFSSMLRYGNGGQSWRPVSLLFEQKSIVWGMDSPLEASFLQTFSRASCRISQGQKFPGPVWYSKEFSNGFYALQTSVEIGLGSTSSSAHLYASKNLNDWTELASFKKDIFPKRLFKFGVIAFAQGDQSSDDFVIFGESLVGLDGKILNVCIED